MDINVSDLDFGVLVTIGEKVDAFNFAQTKEKISSAYEMGKQQMAIDLSRAPFLSLQSIKYLFSLAIELEQKGGKLALISPSEKVGRNIDIFASLDPMDIYGSIGEWEEANSGASGVNQSIRA